MIYNSSFYAFYGKGREGESLDTAPYYSGVLRSSRQTVNLRRAVGVLHRVIRKFNRGGKSPTSALLRVSPTCRSFHRKTNCSAIFIVLP